MKWKQIISYLQRRSSHTNFYLPQSMQENIVQKCIQLSQQQGVDILEYLKIAAVQGMIFAHEITHLIVPLSQKSFQYLQDIKWIQPIDAPSNEYNHVLNDYTWYQFSNLDLQTTLYNTLSLEEKHKFHTQLAQTWEDQNNSKYISYIIYHYTHGNHILKQYQYKIQQLQEQYKENNIEKAILQTKETIQCLEKQPLNTDIKNMLKILYSLLIEHTNQPDQQMLYYKKLHFLFPSNFTILYSLAKIEQQLQYLTDAQQHFQTIVDNSSVPQQRLEALFPLLHILLKKNTTQKKIDSLCKLTQNLLPTTSEYEGSWYHIQGKIKQQQGIYGLAQEYYERALHCITNEEEKAEIHITLATFYWSLGNYPQTLLHLEQAQNLSSSHHMQIIFFQYRLYIHQGTYQNSKPLKPILSEPYNHILQAEIHFQKEQYFQTIECYLQALSTLTEEIIQSQIHEKIAESYQKVYDFSQAELYFQQSCEFYKQQDCWILQAIYQWKQGKFYNNPEYFYESLSTLKNQNANWLEAQVHQSLGIYFYSKHKYKEAKTHLQKATNTFKRHQMLHLQIENFLYQGYIQQQQGNYKDALEYYQQAHQINIEQNNKYQTIQIYMAQSQTNIKLQDYDKAIMHLTNALEWTVQLHYKRQQAKLHILLAQAHLNNNNIEKTFHHIQQLSTLPMTPCANIQLSKIYIQLQDMETAQTILNNQPSNINIDEKANTLYYQGKIHLYNKKTLCAMECFSQCRDLQIQQENIQEIARVYFQLGQTYIQFNRTDKALECFQKSKETWQILQNTPMIAKSYLNLAQLYTCEGNTQEAIQHYTEALQLYKNIDILQAHHIEEKIESLS